MSLHNNKLLLKMLDISIKGHIENEICTYCKIVHNKDHRCNSGEFCSDLIYDGLLKAALEE